MRACLSVLFAWAALVSGGAIISAEIGPKDTVTLEAGNVFPVRVMTLPDEVEGCFLVTPQGESIQFENLSSDKYEIQEPNVLYGCQVNIKNIEENDNGLWEVYYTTNGQKQGSHYYEVTVNAGQQEVWAVPSNIRLAQGTDFHVRLEKPTTLQNTCVLIGPTRSDAERDSHFVDTCGFIVRNVTPADEGTWEISYGTNTTYRALIHVHVIERNDSFQNQLVWNKNAPLDVIVGPEDTVFCKVEDPSGRTAFEGFGRCNIALDRVREEHAGVWKATISRVGRVLTETSQFTVNVAKTSKPQITTTVVTNKPSVMLTCQVATTHNVTACMFNDPSGNILLAAQGIGQDRYTFYLTEDSMNSEVSIRECGLRITDPAVTDLGLWRCGVETDEEIYYGFLTVLCPWAMMDPTVAAAVVTEPVLTAEAESITAVEGDMVTMRCSVPASIRYCYFRYQNGSIWNVRPGSSDWFEYVGNGLESGECSIRFPALMPSDSGRWSCHVGFEDASEPEQRVQIQLLVHEQMFADQIDEPSYLVVHSQVHDQLPLDYCRFIRIDGQGFISENLPEGYQDHSILSSGKCEIWIPNANILEHHPWTVAAKVTGRDSELVRNTQHTITGGGGHGHGDYDQQEAPPHRGSNFPLIFASVLTCVSLAILVVALLFGPKRNRDWTYQRASNIRSSFRASMFKKPLTEELHNGQHVRGTPMAA